MHRVYTARSSSTSTSYAPSSSWSRCSPRCGLMACWATGAVDGIASMAPSSSSRCPPFLPSFFPSPTSPSCSSSGCCVPSASSASSTSSLPLRRIFHCYLHFCTPFYSPLRPYLPKILRHTLGFHLQCLPALHHRGLVRHPRFHRCHLWPLGHLLRPALLRLPPHHRRRHRSLSHQLRLRRCYGQRQ